MSKHIIFDIKRYYWNFRRKDREPGPVIGVQVERNWAWRWYAKVKVHGPSEIAFDLKKRLIDGTPLRVVTNAPLSCYDRDGELVDEWD